MSEIQNYISPANILNIDPKQTVLHSEPVYSDLQDLKRMKCSNLLFYKKLYHILHQNNLNKDNKKFSFTFCIFFVTLIY